MREAGQGQRGGAGAAADPFVGLEHQHAPALARQQRRGGQAVGARPHHHGVEARLPGAGAGAARVAAHGSPVASHVNVSPSRRTRHAPPMWLKTTRARSRAARTINAVLLARMVAASTQTTLCAGSSNSKA